MKKNVMLTFCMIAMTMCLSFSPLIAASSVPSDSEVRDAVQRQRDLQNVNQQLQKELDNLVRDKTLERVANERAAQDTANNIRAISDPSRVSEEAKQEGINKVLKEPQETFEKAVADKRAENARYLEEKTKEFYGKFGDVSSDAVKKQIIVDGAAKAAFDSTPGGDREKYEGASGAYARTAGLPAYGTIVGDPAYREGVQKQIDIENFKNDITKRINEGPGTEEEKQARITSAVADKTREVYRFQGEPTSDIKEKMAFDKALTPLVSNGAGGVDDQRFNLTVNDPNISRDTLAAIRKTAQAELQPGAASATTSATTRAATVTPTEENASTEEGTTPTTPPGTTPNAEGVTTTESLTTTTPPGTPGAPPASTEAEPAKDKDVAPELF